MGTELFFLAKAIQIFWREWEDKGLKSCPTTMITEISTVECASDGVLSVLEAFLFKSPRNTTR